MVAWMVNLFKGGTETSENKKMKNGKAHGLWASWFKNGQLNLSKWLPWQTLWSTKRWYLNGQKKMNQCIGMVVFL